MVDSILVVQTDSSRTLAGRPHLSSAVTAMGIASGCIEMLWLRTFFAPRFRWLFECVEGISRPVGPVRILSVVLMITSRQTGNT